MKRLLDYDPLTGISTYHDYDESTGQTIIITEQNLEPQLEHNKRLAIETDLKGQIKKGLWHYAHIPNVIIEKWMREDGINVYDKAHAKAVFKKLADPDNRHLKVTEGKHLIK